MDVLTYQRKLFHQYKTSIDFPEDRAFLHGNPIPVTVPVETHKNGCMVIGSWPKALRYELEEEKDVPLESVRYPFAPEPYFDGRSVCVPEGSQELNDVLQKLGFARDQAWITTLVKVFLFDSKDVAKYNSLGNFKVAPDAYHFTQYAQQSLHWLSQEAEIAKPSLLLLMGLEAVGFFFDTSPTKAKHFIDGEKRFITLGKHKYPVLCLQEPQILVTSNKRNPWPDVFVQRVIPEAQSWLQHQGDQAA